jgi:hypothetical protein
MDGLIRQVKDVLNFKKRNMWIVFAAVILSIGIIMACAIELLPADIDTNIYGYYAFEENIYTNPLSSFLPLKDNMPHYELADNSLKIYNEDGSIQEIAMTFEKKDFDKNAFKTLFEMYIEIPDISQYRDCHQYAVSVEDTPEYRLYVMDDEVWLASLTSNRVMWCIYKLMKIDNGQT